MSNLYGENVAMMSLISEADIIVKFVIFILFLSSFWSWTIIFDKFLKFKQLNRKARKFEKEFWSAKDLLNFYKKVQDKNDNPFTAIFVTAINEWELQSAVSKNDSYEKEKLRERVFQAMMVSRNKAAQKIQKNINFLAIIASSAPFIGLFGTVWGIMNSFSSIASSQNTSLSVVAPGIAEALFATAIGLFAAIPALIFYNILSSKLNNYLDRIDDLSVEIINLLARKQKNT